eukprot:gene9588-biopygen1594
MQKNITSSLPLPPPAPPPVQGKKTEHAVLHRACRVARRVTEHAVWRRVSRRVAPCGAVWCRVAPCGTVWRRVAPRGAVRRRAADRFGAPFAEHFSGVKVAANLTGQMFSQRCSKS